MVINVGLLVIDLAFNVIGLLCTIRTCAVPVVVVDNRNAVCSYKA